MKCAIQPQAVSPFRSTAVATTPMPSFDTATSRSKRFPALSEQNPETPASPKNRDTRAAIPIRIRYNVYLALMLRACFATTQFVPGSWVTRAPEHVGRWAWILELKRRASICGRSFRIVMEKRLNRATPGAGCNPCARVLPLCCQGKSVTYVSERSITRGHRSPVHCIRGATLRV